jgi:hypothetical protein
LATAVRKLRVANRVRYQVLLLFAQSSRRYVSPPHSEVGVLRWGYSSNSNLVGRFDADPHLAAAHLDNCDLNARIYENPFANFAAQNKHLTPP